MRFRRQTPLNRAIQKLEESIMLLEASPIKELQKAVENNSEKVVAPTDTEDFKKTVELFNTKIKDKKGLDPYVNFKNKQGQVVVNDWIAAVKGRLNEIEASKYKKSWEKKFKMAKGLPAILYADEPDYQIYVIENQKAARDATHGVLGGDNQFGIVDPALNFDGLSNNEKLLLMEEQNKKNRRKNPHNTYDSFYNAPDSSVGEAEHSEQDFTAKECAEFLARASSILIPSWCVAGSDRGHTFWKSSYGLDDADFPQALLFVSKRHVNWRFFITITENEEVGEVRDPWQCGGGDDSVDFGIRVMQYCFNTKNDKAGHFASYQSASDYIDKIVDEVVHNEKLINIRQTRVESEDDIVRIPKEASSNNAHDVQHAIEEGFDFNQPPVTQTNNYNDAYFKVGDLYLKPTTTLGLHVLRYLNGNEEEKEIISLITEKPFFGLGDMTNVYQEIRQKNGYYAKRRKAINDVQFAVFPQNVFYTLYCDDFLKTALAKSCHDISNSDEFTKYMLMSLHCDKDGTATLVNMSKRGFDLAHTDLTEVMGSKNIDGPSNISMFDYIVTQFYEEIEENESVIQEKLEVLLTQIDILNTEGVFDNQDYASPLVTINYATTSRYIYNLPQNKWNATMHILRKLVDLGFSPEEGMGDVKENGKKLPDWNVIDFYKAVERFCTPRNASTVVTNDFNRRVKQVHDIFNKTESESKEESFSPLEFAEKLKHFNSLMFGSFPSDNERLKAFTDFREYIKANGEHIDMMTLLRDLTGNGLSPIAILLGCNGGGVQKGEKSHVLVKGLRYTVQLIKQFVQNGTISIFHPFELNDKYNISMPKFYGNNAKMYDAKSDTSNICEFFLKLILTYTAYDSSHRIPEDIIDAFREILSVVPDAPNKEDLRERARMIISASSRAQENGYGLWEREYQDILNVEERAPKWYFGLPFLTYHEHKEGVSYIVENMEMVLDYMFRKF